MGTSGELEEDLDVCCFLRLLVEALDFLLLDLVEER